MDYRGDDSTASGQPGAPSTIPTSGTVRSLTESQGARSGLYDVKNQTGRDWLYSTRQEPPMPRTTPHVDAGPVPPLAAREHVRQLLREATDQSHSLWTADDPRDISLAGVQLMDTLRGLWRHRSIRESEWTEALNLLQIALTGVEFERLATPQRHSLALIFEEQLLSRTVGRSEMERLFQLLRDGSFDPWRGISETTLGDGPDADRW